MPERLNSGLSPEEILGQLNDTFCSGGRKNYKLLDDKITEIVPLGYVVCMRLQTVELFRSMKDIGLSATQEVILRYYGTCVTNGVSYKLIWK